MNSRETTFGFEFRLPATGQTDGFATLDDAHDALPEFRVKTVWTARVDLGDRVVVLEDESREALAAKVRDVTKFGVSLGIGLGGSCAPME